MAESIKGFSYDKTNVIVDNDGSTPIMAGRGFVGKLLVTKVGSADWDITVYDGTVAGGTKLVNAWTNPSVGDKLEFDCMFTASLTIVTTSTTHGELLVTYHSFGTG